MGGATAEAKKEDGPPAKARPFGSSLSSVFMHADAADVVLMALGLVGAIGDGLSMPVMLFITSRIFNDLGGSSAVVLQEFSSKINEVRTHPQNSTFIYTHCLIRDHPLTIDLVIFLWNGPLDQNARNLVFLALGCWVMSFLGEQEHIYLDANNGVRAMPQLSSCLPCV